MVNKSSTTEIFIGRDDALERLEANFKKLTKEGRGLVVLVAGEAGIGKTTVVNRFLNSLSPFQESKQSSSTPPFCVLQAKCNDITTTGNPYAPFAELLDGLPDAESKRFKEALQDWAQDLGPKVLEGVVPYLGPLLARILERQLPKRDQGRQVDTAIASGQMYQFLQLLGQVSEVSPLILFIDDLHWADESSIGLIFALARRMAEIPILLIGTYRPHDIVGRPGYPAHPLSRVLLEMQRYNLCEEILLEQFTLDEVKSFLDRRYPNNRFSSSLVKILNDKTGGIPFFLDQVVRLLTDEGNIFLDTDNRWAARPLDTIPLPESALAVVQARVNNLDAASGDLLRYASIMGERFRSRVLAKIFEQNHLSVLRTLRILENDHNLVSQRTKTAQSSLRSNWEFRHAFVRQALYDSLAADERAEVHSLAVDALGSSFSDVRDDLAGELAHHCEAAGRYEEAIQYRIVAARRANRARSWLEQGMHCVQGISDVKRLEPRQARFKDEINFLSGLTDTYRRTMELDKEEKVGNELLQLARQYDDPVAEIEGCSALLYNTIRQEDGDSIRKYFTQAWSAAHQSDLIHHLARAVISVQAMNSVRTVYKFIPKQLKQRLDEAIDVFREGKAFSFLSLALQIRGVVAILENEDDQALSFFTEAIKVAELIEDIDERFSKDYPFSENYFTPVEAISYSSEYIARIYRRHGDWHQAIREFKQVYKRKEAVKNLPGMAGLLNVIAETQLLAGTIEEAEQSIEQSWIIGQQTDVVELKAMVLSTGISIALELENDADAETRLQLFEDVTRDWGVEWTWHKSQITRGILRMRAGETDQAVNLLTVGLKAAEENDNLGLITQYSIRLAELNLHSSNLDQALHYADNAFQTAREHSLWELGETCLIAAHIRIQMGQNDEATTLIEQAIEYFQSKNLLRKVALAQDFRQKIKDT